MMNTEADIPKGSTDNLGDYVVYHASEGSMRGRCPHKHRELYTAMRCRDRDRAAARRQGEHSDRQLIAVRRSGLVEYIERDAAEIAARRAQGGAA